MGRAPYVPFRTGQWYGINAIVGTWIIFLNITVKSRVKGRMWGLLLPVCWALLQQVLKQDFQTYSNKNESASYFKL